MVFATASGSGNREIVDAVSNHDVGPPLYDRSDQAWDCFLGILVIAVGVDDDDADFSGRAGENNTSEQD